ncbi:uncharacterized protein LOC130810396 [Amaranthus tricolor]|uniref:uncharacterized protein LOC130810396 n=1 Tax=Amaranthus tricolor TaxID=29722 RepID=UPI00258F2577|nr:uncharacterized protein LOC130810396 [Amaranthus tricolor]
MTLKTLPNIFQNHHHHQQQQSSSTTLLVLSPFSWLFLNRRRRIFFLILTSPVLIPLLCFCFPLICLCQLWFCISRRQQNRRRDDLGLRRCEEGREQDDYNDHDQSEEREIGWILLQRYLEDQLGLVGSVVSVYDCADHDDFVDVDDQIIHDDETRQPFLI